jgi:starch-binding outer membrane protein, SusD/RagB family
MRRPTIGTKMPNIFHGPLGGPARLLAGAAATAGILLAGCNQDSLLSVSSPTRIPASSLESPSNAPILLSGAIADFECAFGAYVVASGLIADELEDATQTSARYPYDQRTLTPRDLLYATSPCEGLGVYAPLQTARVSADNLRRLLLTWTDQQVPDRTTMLATATAFEAYATLLLGEGFCTTTLSTLNTDKTINYGTELPSAETLDSAIARFTEAIGAAQTANATDILNLARVGRARARLDRGDLAGARSDAALVPLTFHYDATGSSVSSRRNNRVWADNGSVGGGSYNTGSSVGADYRTLNDPRVPVLNTGRTAAGTKVPIWVQTKYPDASASIPIASGVEAQLIVAEGDIATNPANALAILNVIRATGNEPPLPAGSTAADLTAALITERQRALFLQGTRLYDIIRLKLPLAPPAGATFPGGGSYGSQLCMPLPDVERLNNPKLAPST